jgi:Arc/MetJ-type ribon-helix-helix transcriptional regulator
MDMQLSTESQRFITEQVARGRYPSEAAVIEAALATLRRQAAPVAAGPDPLAGALGDDPDLIDEIVEEAMQIRESRPWRLPAGK